MLCTSVLAYDYGSVNNFDLFRFYGESSNHSLNGTYTIIDSNEFLALITACMAVNDEFREWCGQDPYAVMSARFNDSTSQDFMVVTYAPREYMYKESVLADPPVDPIMVNGLLLDPYNHDGFILYDSNCIFDDSLTVNNCFGDTYKLLVAKNDADRVLCFDIGTQPVMSTILARLTSIRNDVAAIKPYMSDFSTVLTNIYYALGTLDTDLGNLNNRLQSINTEITVIKGLCQSLLGNSNSELTLLNNYLPEFDDDLDDIAADLTLFRTNFATYASAALAEMEQANDSLEDINGTLSDINDMLNGKALEDVPVSGGSTGYSGNLWGLIKFGVTSTINGFAQFFDSIISTLAYFTTTGSQGFSAFANLDQYETVNYRPGFAVNILNINSNVTNYGVKATFNSNSVTLKQVSNLSTGSKTLNSSNFTLSAGTYEFVSSSASSGWPYVSLYRQQAGNYGTIVSRNGSFTLNSTTTVCVRVAFDCDNFQNGSLTYALYES